MTDISWSRPKLYISDSDISFKVNIERVFISLGEEGLKPGIYAEVSFTEISDKLAALLDLKSESLFYNLKHLTNIKTAPYNMSIPRLNDLIEDIFTEQFEAQMGFSPAEYKDLLNDEDMVWTYNKGRGKGKKKGIRIIITEELIQTIVRERERRREKAKTR